MTSEKTVKAVISVLLLTFIDIVFDTKDTCLIITSNMILYILIMLLVFEHIPIAFSLIPDAEMGVGFLQLLIKIFACAAAGICAVVSLVVLAINRSQNTY